MTDTHRQTDASDLIICPMLCYIAMGQIKDFNCIDWVISYVYTIYKLHNIFVVNLMQ